ITVGYEGLQQAANQLKSGKQDLVTTLKDLQSVIRSLTGGGFKTRVASGRFQTHYDNWTQSATDLISSLDDISRAIQDAQQKHEQADAALAEGAGGLGNAR
ncbi:MAG TPA: WXG100 family type VII secretion target, partial [Acidimicrobiales bacterium]